jgi:uncharacterized LabA/DUF88 family protein
MSENSPPANPVLAPAPAVPAAKKTVVYVDGFNFYYGLLHERPDLKWLNYQRLAELLRPNDEILKVKLFSALVDQAKPVSEMRDRQKRLFRALGLQPKFGLILGKFAERERECLVYSCPNRRKFWALEEKQTDVNIAIHMVRDVAELKPQVMVLISGDIDLLPALKEVKRLNRTTHLSIFIPAPEAQLGRRRKDEMGNLGLVQPIPEKFLRMAQFPDRVPDGKGGFIERPKEWPSAK